MMSSFFHFRHTLNRLFNNCIKGAGGQIDPPPEKTTLKKSSLIRVNGNFLNSVNII